MQTKLKILSIFILINIYLDKQNLQDLTHSLNNWVSLTYWQKVWFSDLACEKYFVKRGKTHFYNLYALKKKFTSNCKLELRGYPLLLRIWRVLNTRETFINILNLNILSLIFSKFKKISIFTTFNVILTYILLNLHVFVELSHLYSNINVSNYKRKVREFMTCLIYKRKWNKRNKKKMR